MDNQPSKRRVIVLGAGPTGLSCAWQLVHAGFTVTVLEKREEVGGHGGTYTIHGYNVDEGPHKLYPQVPCAKPMIDRFVGKDLLTMSKTSQVYINGRYMNYPFGIGDLFGALGFTTGLKCGLSFASGKFKSFFRRQDRTYTDFVHRHFGAYTHHLVFKEVAEKLWGNPDELDVQLAKTRIIAPSIIELLKGLFFGFKGKPKLSADEFYYPRYGLRQLWRAMQKDIEKEGGTVITQALPTLVRRNPSGTFSVFYVREDKNYEVEADVLVSTIPVSIIYELFDPAPSSEAMQAVSALKLSSLYILYLVVDTPRLLKVNWIFFPESKYHYARISEQKGFSEEMVPKDRTVLTVEIPAARAHIGKKAKENQEALKDEVIDQLKEVGILQAHHRVLDAFFNYSSSIYPIYDLEFKNNLARVLEYSDSIPNFYLNGRLGLFCYNNMDHSMEMGTLLGDHIARDNIIAQWQKLRETFYEYKIVD